MGTSYPGGIDSFTNPVATNPMTSPDHATQHAKENLAIEAIETQVGTTGAFNFLENSSNLSDVANPVTALANLGGAPATAGVVEIANGGTGATTALAALAALGAVPLQLWEGITNGNITIPRFGQGDSGSFSATPASQTIHYTYFIAQQSETASYIRFQTGGTAQATNTYTNVGLYTVNASTGALTLVANGTATALSGTYATQTFTLTSSYSLVAGTLYAVGLLQYATTVASVIGSWFNGGYMGAAQGLAFTGATGLSTLPSTATAPTNASAVPFYYEIY